jgi:esterase/lipase superfamily enzyme
MKMASAWHSDRVEEEVRLIRWGHFGRPVLVFPTAGGDAEEIERQGLIDALGCLIQSGRIKVFSLDSIAGRSWLRRDNPRHSMWLQNRFDEVIFREVVPAIRADCQSPGIEIISAGASIGAFNAVASLCRHPADFRAAIGMSGTYDLTGWLGGEWSDDFYYSSPLHYLPGLGSEAVLAQLRSRFVVLATGQGRWEDAGETWKLAQVLGAKAIPNRVDVWSEQHDHDWPTWREMLPLYLDDLA